MNFKVANPILDAVHTEPTPADRAANSALWTSVASVVVIGLTVWSASLGFGALAFYGGFGIWLILWTVSIGMALGALRNHHSSINRVLLRRRAGAALAISAVNLIMVCSFLLSVMKMIEGR